MCAILLHTGPQGAGPGVGAVTIAAESMIRPLLVCTRNCYFFPLVCVCIMRRVKS